MHVDAGGDLGIDTLAWTRRAVTERGDRIAMQTGPRDRWIDAGLMAAAVSLAVAAVFNPCDSIAVERGESLGWCAGVLAWLAMLFALRWGGEQRFGDGASRIDSAIDLLPMMIGLWVLGGALAMRFDWTGPRWLGGDAGSAMNEAWVWVACAGWLVGVRRWCRDPQIAQALIGLVLVAVAMLSVHALHQSFVSMPQTMREYLSNPDAQLQSLGLDAPPGSATRMIFESRLRDGGPTATFSLANSLAGPLVMGAAILVTIFVGQWGRGDAWRTQVQSLVSPGLIACVFALALVLTNSRGAMGALTIATAGCVARVLPTRLRRPALIGGIAIGLVLAAGLAIFGRGSEWIDQAPASVAYRLQYWKATLAMVADRPVGGIGPGNFQIVYPAYRDESAHETIAEPHNFWFETLAAGGWVAASLLTIFLIVALVKFGRQSFPPVAERWPDPKHLWIGWGIGFWVGIGLVWTLGLRSGRVPDLDAALIAIPIAGAVGAWWLFAGRWRCDVRWAATVGSASGLLHLGFSGGWTIPGVAWIVATLGGVALSGTASKSHRWRAGWGVPWLSLAILCAVLSWWPHQRRDSAIESVQWMLSRGQNQTATKTLGALVESDPSASVAALWWLQSKVRDTDFDSAVATCETAIGNDAAHIALLANLYVHRFQIAGRREDLTAAWQWIGQSLVRNPTHETVMAQASEIRRELGTDFDASWPVDAPENRVSRLPRPNDWRTLADRAIQLSDAGNVVTRDLRLQLILPATLVGKNALAQPVRKSAHELLRVTVPGTDSPESR